MNDPRTTKVSDLRVGQPLRNSRIRTIVPQKKGGRNGLRIMLEDGRSGWGSAADMQRSVEFAKRA